jgi:hypothetical protein
MAMFLNLLRFWESARLNEGEAAVAYRPSVFVLIFRLPEGRNERHPEAGGDSGDGCRRI